MNTPTAQRDGVVEATGRDGARRFLAFRRDLYDGDPGYSATLEFAVESVLGQTSAFTRSCFVRPLLAHEEGRVVAQCILVHDPALPLLQVAFFEALPQRQAAVDALLDEARTEARRRGLDRIVIGLNGHLSLGVGILTEGFAPASFDSTWNKPYYAGYFEGLTRAGLTAFGGEVPAVLRRVRSLGTPDAAVRVRPVDLHDWDAELETFRTLCDATLGTTSLYAPTRPRHFAELMGDLKPFLRPEHLLFAEQDGRAVGFCFWHPDYNRTLPYGRRLGVPSIAWRFALRRNRVRTVVLNAIGVLPEVRGSATHALLARVGEMIEGHYDDYETCFVWDDNLASLGINRYLGNDVIRRFAVWFDEVAP